MISLRALAAPLLAATLLVGCSASAGDEVRGRDAVLDLAYDSTPKVEAAAQASQRLAWKVIEATDGPNRLTSPSSLAMSLAMVAEGARGDSTASIDAELGLAGEERGRAFGALRQSLAGYESLPEKVSVDDPPETPIVHLAGQVLSIEATPEADFLDALARYYDTPATVADRGQAQKALDGWVRRNTAGLIERSGIRVTEATSVVVQDAVLFAAAWGNGEMDETSLEFATPAGTQRVDAISATVRVSYAEDPEGRWRAVRLPYDDALAADVIIADSPTIADLEAVSDSLDTAERVDVVVTMPSFDLSGTTDLLAALPGLALSDLSGITPGGTAEQWTQQVRLQVGARGTVGAAVTEFAEAGSAPVEQAPIEFTVDHPYVFRVSDTRTHWPLFLAAIADPTAE